MAATQNLVWDVALPEGFDPTRSYLVVCNHRSWTDIFVLQHVFRGRIPFLKFFLKKELIWVPFLGIVWWALEFPFMQRYSRAFLTKHPELRGRGADTVGRGYVEDPDFSARMRAWVDRLWQEKDRLLDRLQGPAES